MPPLLIVLTIAFQLRSGKFIPVDNLCIVVRQAWIDTAPAAGMTFVNRTPRPRAGARAHPSVADRAAAFP